MKLIVFLTVTAAVIAASSCDNPLFSTANWPSGLTRPRYLTTPAAVTNSTFCTKFQSGSTQTCCDANTIQDIVSVFQSRRDDMKKRGENLQGGVRDTFNDFDPDNQKAKGARLLDSDSVQEPLQGDEGRGLEEKGRASPKSSSAASSSTGKNSTAIPPPPHNGTEHDGKNSTTTPPHNETEHDGKNSTTTPPHNGTEPVGKNSTTTPPHNGTEHDGKNSTTTPPHNETEHDWKNSTTTPPHNGTESVGKNSTTTPPHNGTEPVGKNSTATVPHNETGAKGPRFLSEVPEALIGSSPRGLATNPPWITSGTGTTTNTTGSANTTTTGGTTNSSLGKPPKQNNPAGFNNVDVPDSNLTSASPSMGRGKEKKRPGILKMSTAGQNAMKNITRAMNALMKQFAYTMGKCMVGQLKHLAGMMCMGCDPEWASWVSNTTASITVSLANDACTTLTDACLDFVTQAQNLPALIEEYKTSIQAVIDSEIAAGKITAADVSTSDLTSLTKPSTAVTALCTSTDTCKTYICNTLSKGQTGVVPDSSTVADPASVSAISSSRQLTASVTYQFSDSGYNSVNLGTTATSSSAATTTDGSLIDGVSTTTAPLTTSTSLAVLLAMIAAEYLLAL